MIAKAEIFNLLERVKELALRVDLEGKRRLLAQIDEQMLAPQAPAVDEVMRLSKSRADLIREITPFDKLFALADDLLALVELAGEAGVGLVVPPSDGVAGLGAGGGAAFEIEQLEAEGDLMMKDLLMGLEDLTISTSFAAPEDKMGCFVEINAGAGGTDSQDLAQSLVRMYTMWAQKKGYAVRNLDFSAGEEAGLKSAVLEISGYLAFGYMKGENGVHRFVRISPFNANDKRQTSFVSVFAYPICDTMDSVELLDKDLRIDTYRSSGAGGQHVNTTDSAVRITHLPTGLVAQSQSQRSQAQNKNEAMRMLLGKLMKLRQQQQDKVKSQIEGTKADISWGNQIRNYVFHPYKMVKDLRSGYETGRVEDIMDGYLDELMNSLLAGGSAGSGVGKSG